MNAVRSAALLLDTPRPFTPEAFELVRAVSPRRALVLSAEHHVLAHGVTTGLVREWITDPEGGLLMEILETILTKHVARLSPVCVFPWDFLAEMLPEAFEGPSRLSEELLAGLGDDATREERRAALRGLYRLAQKAWPKGKAPHALAKDYIRRLGWNPDLRTVPTPTSPSFVAVYGWLVKVVFWSFHSVGVKP